MSLVLIDRPSPCVSLMRLGRHVPIAIFVFFSETFLSCRNLVIDAVIPTFPASPSADDT